jgi:membrane-associated phospholipid phosphatase
MKNYLFLSIVISMMNILGVNAENYKNMESFKLETPEMKPELVALPTNPFAEQSVKTDAAYNKTYSQGMDFRFFKQVTNPGVKPYKFIDDLTFVGIPLFVAGWAIKGDKAMFRVNNKDGKSNTQLLTDFKTGIDDYTQFFGPVMTAGLKLAGVEGRSDWPRLLASAAVSYGLMAGLVNGIKYSAKEMRPDGSTANSWPSGHTATAFVGATLLHKEYGLTRSPWYSVAGYGVATATGVMRVLNNRHWISDIMSGAGIGIMSGELGYALIDLLFKEKGLLRNDLEMNFENPSFFSISMGVGLGGKDIEFNRNDLQYAEYYDADFHSIVEEAPIEFRAATVVDAEGAYFLNKYIGIGGRLRVRAMSAKSFGNFSNIAGLEGYSAWAGFGDIYDATDPQFDYENYYNTLGFDTADSPVSEIGGIVKSDHMTEFVASLGLYVNIPLSKHFALGTKALVGRSFTQELDIDGYARGNQKDIDYEMTIKNGQFTNATVAYPKSTGETYYDEWDYLTLGSDAATSWGTGISLTYKYKSNFSWKVFMDYDYSEKTFTLKYNPYHFLKYGMTENAYMLTGFSDIAYQLEPVEYKKKKNMNNFTLGLSFLVNL